MLYPLTIQYGGNGSIAHAYQIRFTYTPLPAGDLGFIRYIGGVRTRLTQFLQTITVEHLTTPATFIRDYNLAYDSQTQTNGANGHRWLLNTVTATGYPPEKFSYSTGVASHAITSFGALPGGLTQLRRMNETSDVFQTLLDMNGDGFVDVVNAPGAADWVVYAGGRLDSRQLESPGMRPPSEIVRISATCGPIPAIAMMASPAW